MLPRGGSTVNLVFAVVRANLDRAAGWGLIAAGGAAVVIGWSQVSFAGDAVNQVSYLITGGLAGLVLVFVGIFVLLSADLTDQERALAGPAGATTSRRRHAYAVAAAAAAAAVLVGLGWQVASTASDGSSTIPGALLATAGVVLLAATVGMGLARWSGRLRAGADVQESSVGPGSATADTVIVAPGLTRFHQPGCLAVAATDGQPVPLASVPADLQPCGICHALVATPLEVAR